MADAAAAPPVNPLDGGTDRLRETAKWLTVSLGTIGSLLIAGVQLTGFGKLDNIPGRQTAAIVALAIAVVGVIVILGAALLTMTKRPSILADINGFTQADYPQFLTDQKTGKALTAAYIKAANVRVDRYRKLNNMAVPTQQALDAFKRAENQFDLLNDQVHGLLAAANYNNVAGRFKGTISVMAAGVILVSGGVAWFAWAVNPPDKIVASAASPGVLDGPQVGTVTLQPAGVTLLQTAVGGDVCSLAGAVPAVALETPADAPPEVVISPPGAGCKPVRLVLDGQWGAFTGK